jgi:fatty acid desaturase
VVRSQVFRHSSRDVYLVALSLLHPIALVLAPSIPLIAIGVWWNSNTISHHFLHLPFFQSKTANRTYSLYLSALLGIPQSIWRDRHLAHHRGDPAHVRWRSLAAADTMMVFVVWGVLALMSPWFFLMVYIPGIILGLALCYLHGYFEHAGGTTSNYGMVYNFAFFNDGYHVEHHARPTQHWTRMRELVANDTRVSRWPAVFRWMEFFRLETR